MTTDTTTPTPRSQTAKIRLPKAIIAKVGNTFKGVLEVVPVDACEQLERELVEARAMAERAWERHAEKDAAYGKALDERDSLRSQLTALEDQLAEAKDRIATLEKEADEWLDRNQILAGRNVVLDRERAEVAKLATELRREIAELAESLGGRMSKFVLAQERAEKWEKVAVSLHAALERLNVIYRTEWDCDSVGCNPNWLTAAFAAYAALKEGR